MKQELFGNGGCWWEGSVFHCLCCVFSVVFVFNYICFVGSKSIMVSRSNFLSGFKAAHLSEMSYVLSESITTRRKLLYRIETKWPARRLFFDAKCSPAAWDRSSTVLLVHPLQEIIIGSSRPPNRRRLSLDGRISEKEVAMPTVPCCSSVGRWVDSKNCHPGFATFIISLMGSNMTC